MIPQNFIAIVLAAGASSRYGSAKQLLDYKNQPLINHIIEQLRGAGMDRIIVVTGAYHHEIAPILPPGVEIVCNTEWKKGMGHSIAFGVNAAAERYKYCDGVLISLSDQPAISSLHFRALVETVSEENCEAAATTYDQFPGVPATFRRSLFPLLAGLSGDQGARQLLLGLGTRVKLVSSDSIIDDIDSPEEYRAFLARQL